MRRGLVVGGYDQKSVPSVDIVTDGTADKNRALVHERVHECRMFVEALLRVTRATCIPGRAVALGDEVVPHAATVPTRAIIGVPKPSRVDEGDYLFCRRSSSAPKKLAEAWRTSLGRRSSVTIGTARSFSSGG